MARPVLVLVYDDPGTWFGIDARYRSLAPALRSIRSCKY
jgi:hypothetical protein